MDSNVFLTGINSGKFAWLLVYVLVYTVYVINVDRSSVYGAQVYSHGFVLTLWLFFYVGKSIIGTYFGRSYLTIIALALLFTSCYTIVLDAFSLFVTLKERPTWLSVEECILKSTAKTMAQSTPETHTPAEITKVSTGGEYGHSTKHEELTPTHHLTSRLES